MFVRGCIHEAIGEGFVHQVTRGFCVPPDRVPLIHVSVF